MASQPDLGIDMITKKPRTPRDPYSTLTETQKKNIPKDAHLFFMIRKDPKFSDKCWSRGRYVRGTSEHLIRGTSVKQPFCWIDSQWLRGLTEEHNLSGAERWGPDKVGTRTAQHFHKPENCRRFLNLEVYNRPQTNIPGEVWMDYGRPSVGYYMPRFLRSQTWFGANVPLNQNAILEEIRPKLMTEYDQIRQRNANEALRRRTKWPSYSEYTDKIVIGTRVMPFVTTLMSHKLYLEKAAIFTD